MQRNCYAPLKAIQQAIGLVCLLGTSACATIIDGKTQAMTIQSVPPQAQIVISNRAGTEIHNGVTPATVPLKRGAGYFSSEKYSIAISKNGFQPVTVPLEGVVSGWYAGNIVLGGLIGLLSVDPITGAMYQLRPEEAENSAVQPPYRFDKKAGVLTVTLPEQTPLANAPVAAMPSPVSAPAISVAPIAPAPIVQVLPAQAPAQAPVQPRPQAVAPMPAPARVQPQAPVQILAPAATPLKGGSTLISATEFRANPKLSTAATMLPAGTRYERRGQVDNGEGSWWFIAIDKDTGWIPAQMR